MQEQDDEGLASLPLTDAEPLVRHTRSDAHQLFPHKDEDRFRPSFLPSPSPPAACGCEEVLRLRDYPVPRPALSQQECLESRRDLLKCDNVGSGYP